MKYLIPLLLSLSLTSCSMFTSKKIDYSEAYVTGKGAKSLTSSKIKENLTRSFSMAGGNYQIKAFPLTKAYINALGRELPEAGGLSQQEAKILQENLNKKYLKNKNCIQASIEVKEFSQVNNLNQWNLIFTDSNNIEYPMNWLSEAPLYDDESARITSSRMSFHGKEKMWLLLGQACSQSNSKFVEGFKIKFKPSFVQWPFPEDVSEEWSFNYSKIVDGKKVEIKKKERKKESYRGW